MSITNIPSAWFSGRTILRTDLKPENMTAAAIAEDLVRILPEQSYNVQKIRALQEYMRGWHPEIMARVKTTRTDVDNKVPVDYAWSITREIVGYFLGKPIQYTHRKSNRNNRRSMEAFNTALNAENKGLTDYQIAEDCSICGIGFRGIFAESRPTNGTHLKQMRLDPLNTFVVYSSDPLLGAVYAVTAYENQGADRQIYYKVYTANAMYLYKSAGDNGMSAIGGSKLSLIESKLISFGGGLPIVEYENNMWRMGDWEMALPILDALDFVTSDGVNDIQQAVNSVLVVLGAEMTDDIFDNLSQHGFLAVTDVPVGVRPEIKFISEAMPADAGIAIRDYLEATLRVIVGVPDRKTRSGGGGDTGDAVFIRDGWQDIDLVAASKEQYYIQSERESLAVILYILDTHKEVSGLSPLDIEIHFNRNKSANIQSKAQVYTTLVSGDAPLDPADALDIADLTNNVHDVILRSEAYAQKLAERSISRANVSGDPNSTEDAIASPGEDDSTR